MECCGIYFRNGSLYVDSYSCDEFGILVGSAKMLKVEPESPRKVGEAVLAALSTSRKGIPHPEPNEIKKLEKGMYEFMGVKTWAELARTSVYANLEREGTVIKIYPHRIGRGGGFEPDGTSIFCSSTDAEEIGRGILQSLKLQVNA